MNQWNSLLLVAVIVGGSVAGASDWPQWRGPNRTGVADKGPKLADSWPEDGPALLWDSEMIPSNENGGHGSVVAADGRVYMGLVWHEDVPTETRAIDHLVLRRLGHRTLKLPQALIDKMEADRLAINPRAFRGKKLDDYADKWVNENLNEQQRMQIGSWVKGRFRKGPNAISIKVLNTLWENREQRFDSDGSLEKWLDSKDITGSTRKDILKHVPATRKIAYDVIVALDARTGKTIWKTKFDGQPTGRRSSSTACVSGNYVVAAGSTHAHCVDATTGKKLWSQELPSKSVASSFVVVDGLAVILAGSMTAFDLESGKVAWTLKEVGGTNSSPVVWSKDGVNYIVCNERRNIVCVNPKNGSVVWSVPAGGDSTVAIENDIAVVRSKNSDLGLVAFKLSSGGATQLWSHPITSRRTQSTPIVSNGYVYFFGSEIHLCADLRTGKIAWQQKKNANISSPIMADGKLIVIQNRGNELAMVSGSPGSYSELATTKIKAMDCPTPAIIDGKLLLRLKDRIRCLDLRAK